MNKQVVCIILNADTVIHNTEAYLGQSCVFPTIVDLMGIKTKWKGVGESIFMPSSIIHSKYERKRLSMRNEISDMVLCNDYFKTHHIRNNKE